MRSLDLSLHPTTKTSLQRKSCLPEADACLEQDEGEEQEFQVQEIRRCGVCFKASDTSLSFDNSIAQLPCFDSVCRNCFDQHSLTGSLSFHCPVCDRICILPPRLFAASDNADILNNDRDSVYQNSNSSTEMHQDSSSSALLMKSSPQLPARIPVSVSSPLVLDTAPGATCNDCGDHGPLKTMCHQCHVTLCSKCQREFEMESHICHQNRREFKNPIDNTSSSNNSSSMSSPSTPALSCPYHSGEELRFFCSDCECALCRECAETFEHSAHVVVLLRDAVCQHRSMLKSLLEKVQQTLGKTEHSFAMVAAAKQSLASRSTEALTSLNQCFAQLETLLNQRRQILLDELQDSVGSKQQNLSTNECTLRELLSNAKHNFEITSNTVDSGNEAEVLLVAKEIATKLAQFTELDIKSILNEEDYVLFQRTNLETVEELIKCLGLVIDQSKLVSLATVYGEGTKFCSVGRRSQFTLITRAVNGRLVEVDPKLISSEIVSSTTKSQTSTANTVTFVKVSDGRDGTFCLSYVLDKVGLYQLSVKICDQHVTGSPFTVRCLSKAMAPASERSSRSRSTRSKVSFKPSRDTSASDYCSVHGKISIYSEPTASTSGRSHSYSHRSSSRHSSAAPLTTTTTTSASQNQNQISNHFPIDDDLVLKVGRRGRNRGEFTNPQGITSCIDGRVIVADSNNQCIQIFNSEGEFKIKFGTRGRLQGQVQRPTGVACLPNGNLMAADYENKLVSVFDPQGKFVTRFGGGKLLGPKGLAVAPNGQIIVVDQKASSILIYSSSFKFLRRFGSRGLKPHQFAGPQYVAVNSAFHLYITDFHNHCVKVFDGNTMQYLFQFGSMGEGNGQFQAPTGIAIDEDQNVLVADWGNSRIQIFDSSGSFLSFVNSISDPLYGPQDLSIHLQRYVAVADSGNHCYKIYKYLA